MSLASIRSSCSGINSRGETTDVIFQLSIDHWGPLEPTVDEFYAGGSLTAAISAGGLSGFLDGYVAVSLPASEPGYVQCTAPDRSVVFSR